MGEFSLILFRNCTQRIPCRARINYQNGK